MLDFGEERRTKIRKSSPTVYFQGRGDFPEPQLDLQRFCGLEVEKDFLRHSVKLIELGVSSASRFPFSLQ